VEVEPVRKKKHMKFIVHVTGPDDVLDDFDSEIEAFREANAINKICHKAKWDRDDPELYPTVIAMVYTEEEFAESNQ